ncbi:MAG: nucleotidyltransferase family protein [Clostridia bacterium]|nr:nucleotidyltransferase family protein [Clostridia bacterium]
MKNILGVVAEYDPFHRGHEKHLRLARERVQPDFTYVALSGCFKQRGEPALLSPYDRAACALAAGVDAVFCLPTVWTLRDAEHYALGAVSLLAGLGATHLAFGAETADLAGLRAAAELLEKPAAALRDALRQRLRQGEGYPRAMENAMAETRPDLGALLRAPNNTLAICYLRAMLRLDAEMEPVLIPRSGDYHAAEISPENPSASAIRQALARGDYGGAFAAVPAESARRIREAMLARRTPSEKTMDAILIHTLRTMPREQAVRLPDLSEGLEDRVLRAAREAGGREALLTAACASRYPRARISRLCAWAMLGGTAETVERAPLPRETLLLGLRRNTEMSGLWRDGKIRIHASLKDMPPDPAWDLWAQCAGLPAGWFYRQRVVTV